MKGYLSFGNTIVISSLFPQESNLRTSSAKVVQVDRLHIWERLVESESLADICGTGTFDICYLWLAICLLHDTFYLKLAITCQN